MSSVTDTELIERARTGDPMAFRHIVEKYEGQIARTVKGMLGEVPEAEDVGQDVFIRFYRSMEHFRGESALGTYLTRIAINLSLNALKQKKRKEMFRFFSNGEKEPVLQIPDNGKSPDQDDTRVMVHQALQLLDKDFRAVLVLRMIEGYSSKETAEILGVPMGTILSRLSRAQKKLKEILENVYGIHAAEPT
ncbi:MAG: RNA polymerase sigma factor [Bacteroidia bacterium]